VFALRSSITLEDRFLSAVLSNFYSKILSPLRTRHTVVRGVRMWAALMWRMIRAVLGCGAMVIGRVRVFS
jgi:hypothetical protein